MVYFIICNPFIVAIHVFSVCNKTVHPVCITCGVCEIDMMLHVDRTNADDDQYFMLFLLSTES